MHIKSKILSVIARIFSLPPLVAGSFVITKIPESLFFGIFLLVIGLAIFGYKHTLTIDKDQLKTTVRIYHLVLRTKVIKMTEFSCLYLGVASLSTTNGHTSHAPFHIALNYRNPDDYLTADPNIPNAFGLKPFIDFSLGTWNQKNFDNLSKNFMKEVSELTKLPVIYSKEVERDFINR